MVTRSLVMFAIALLPFGINAPSKAQQNAMSFFITSVGLGSGGNLGGLAGADRHCQDLATAAGAGSKTWRAYLSTQGAGGVNAKDRIGRGPWINAKGVQIAANVAELHSDKNNINKQTGLDEKGAVVKGRGDTPNQHDMLTGTQHDGTTVVGPEDATCSNWTSNVDGQGSAVVGHHDLIGNTNGPNFWNYSHKTPGCAQANLQRVGGGGSVLLLCSELSCLPRHINVRFGSKADMCAAKTCAVHKRMSALCQKRTSHAWFEMKEPPTEAAKTRSPGRVPGLGLRSRGRYRFTLSSSR